MKLPRCLRPVGWIPLKMRTAAKSRVALGLAALCCAALPAGAHAAYAPRLTIELDTAERAAVPAITSTITQASGETATRSVTLVFPAGFESNLDVRLTPCTAEQEAAEACPEESRIGSAQAVSGGIELTGPIALSTEAGQLRVLVFLQGLGGLVKQKLVGTVEVGSDNRIKTVFSNLPNTLVTSTTLRFRGGDRGLVRNPRTCGPAVFRGAFTSHSGEEAIAESAVEITGCPTKPVITEATVRPARVRAGRGVVVSWSLSEATRGTRVIVERRARRRGWYRVMSLVGSGRAGDNRLAVNGRRLRPGTYRVSLRATNAAGIASDPRRVPFRVVPR